MARQIAIPGLIRLCIADAPGEVIALARHPALRRGGDAVGPVLNRYVLRNITAALRYRDAVLPSALPRDDAARAAYQQALAAALDPARIDWAALPVDALAAYVKGDRTLPLGPICQQAAGRVFRADYVATRSTWAAAETLDRAARSLNPLTHLWLAVSGGLARAQRRLYAAAGGDTFCMHATGVAVHTLAKTIERLRLALADPSTRAHAPLGEIIGEALLGPDSIVRHTRDFVDDVPDLSLKPGTLVLLKPAAASELTVDHRVSLFAGGWSACPADRFVPALVAHVWQAATGEPPAPPPIAPPPIVEPAP